MKSVGNWDFCDNFLKGMKDCSDGKAPQSEHEAYLRGYNTEKDWEESKREQCSERNSAGH